MAYKILEANIKLALIPILILIIFGEPIFAFFLGEEWREAGTFAAILGMYQMMQFCSSCLSGDFSIIGKNSWNLISAVASLLISLGMILFCRFGPPVSVLTYLSIFSLLMTVKIIIAEAVRFIYLKCAVKDFSLLILKFVIIPCVAAYLLQRVFF